MRSRRGVRWSEANRRWEAAVDNVRGLRVWGVRAENGRISGIVLDGCAAVVSTEKRESAMRRSK